MASFITAGNATNGLQVSSDNTGILELKTGTGSGTTAVTVNASQNAIFAGNVGIGATSPLGSLEIIRNTASGASTAYPNIRLDNQNAAGYTGIYFIQSAAQKAFFELKNDVGALTMGTGSTERARITSDGKFVVGDTTATNALLGTRSASNVPLLAAFSTATSGYTDALVLSEFRSYAPNNASTRLLYSGDNASERCSIRSNGGIANFSANNVNISDRREKTNFAPAKNYLDVICAIPVQTFNYIDQNMEEDPGETLGVVAQDVQAVAPEMVMESNWGTKEEPKMRLSIYQTDLQYALMKSIQELKAIVDAQAAEIAALKGAA